MEVYLNGRKISFNHNSPEASGGEAEIFILGNDKALKLFKTPDHPSYTGSSQQDKLNREGARQRLVEYQKKLKEFPTNLPNRVIVPEELATDKTGRIIGYTMKHLKNAEMMMRYAEKNFREKGISGNQIREIALGLYSTTLKLHRSHVVIGDFNDLNVMIKGKEAYLIDADSFQFGRYLCHGFNEVFVDPLLCNPKADILMQYLPHNENSDWYAFTVMLLKCFLLLRGGAYDGVYIPKDPKKRIPYYLRPLKRVTIFHPEVIYPKPANPCTVLPDDLLQHFHLVFEKDKRGVFPQRLIENLRWTKCVNCGIEHARDTCPSCAKAPAIAVKQKVVIRGKVVSTQFFRTHGVILFAATQKGALKYFYHESGKYRREDSSVVLSGELDHQMRFRLQGDATLIGKDGQVVILLPKEDPEVINVDSFVNLPVFDANEDNYFWLSGGELLKNSKIGPERIADVLSRQTLFWVGPRFGFGFYLAGNLNMAFVFGTKAKGLNDSVKIPKIPGQLVDSTCVFAKNRCWFFAAFEDRGRITNRCVVITSDGHVDAQAEALRGDGSWLSSLRGKCAIGNFLLAATDNGIISVEPQAGKIIKTKEFPDTEPFVDTSCHLFPGTQGLYVVSSHDIKELKILP